MGKSLAWDWPWFLRTAFTTCHRSSLGVISFNNLSVLFFGLAFILEILALTPIFFWIWLVVHVVVAFLAAITTTAAFTLTLFLISIRTLLGFFWWSILVALLLLSITLIELIFSSGGTFINILIIYPLPRSFISVVLFVLSWSLAVVSVMISSVLSFVIPTLMIVLTLLPFLIFVISLPASVVSNYSFAMRLLNFFKVISRVLRLRFLFCSRCLLRLGRLSFFGICESRRLTKLKSSFLIDLVKVFRLILLVVSFSFVPSILICVSASFFLLLSLQPCFRLLVSVLHKYML